MSAALQGCADRGYGRVAVYGAGSHTLRSAHALAAPPVEVVAILDDDNTKAHTTMWGYPIRSLDDAGGLGIDAIVISSDAYEVEMCEKCSGLAGQGIEVVTLYCENSTGVAR
jgi:FlaA1/EpsC-like NDP-sugar epimerase